MTQEEHAAEWARYTEMNPEEFRAVNWVLWIFYSGMTMFGHPSHQAVLRKAPDNPNVARAPGDGATNEEALRGANREALDIEAANQAQPPQK